VTVTGHDSFLGLTNQADLPTAHSQIDGLIFTGNTGGLYVGYPMHVSGKFTYAGNNTGSRPGPHDRRPRLAEELSSYLFNSAALIVPR
jgi:hypothetical protein